MGEKQDVIAELRGEFERWDALAAAVAEAQALRPLEPAGWSLKDELAHLRAWQQRSVARLDAAVGGGEPLFPAWPQGLDPEMEGQPHDLNAWLYEQARARPWAKVREEWREGFLRLIALAEALPEAAMLDAARFPWLEGYTVARILLASREHHDEHYGPVRAALDGRA